MAEFVVEAGEAGLRLDTALARRLGQSRAAAQRLIESGAVTIDGRTAAKGQVLRGERGRYKPPPPAPATLTAEVVPFTLVYEDQALLVVDKPGRRGRPSRAGPRARYAGAGAAAARHRRRSRVAPRSRPPPRPRHVGPADRGPHPRGSSPAGRPDGAPRDRPPLRGAAGRARCPRTKARSTRRSAATCATASASPSTRHGRDARSPTSRCAGAWPATRCSTCDSRRAAPIRSGCTSRPWVFRSPATRPTAGERRRPAGLARQFLHAAHLEFAHPLTGEPLSFDAPLPADLAGVSHRPRGRIGRRGPL